MSFLTTNGVEFRIGVGSMEMLDLVSKIEIIAKPADDVTFIEVLFALNPESIIQKFICGYPQNAPLHFIIDYRDAGWRMVEAGVGEFMGMGSSQIAQGEALTRSIILRHKGMLQMEAR